MHKPGKHILLLHRLKYLKTLNFLELKSRFTVLISLAQQSQLYAWNEVGLIPCKAHAFPTSKTAGTDMNTWDDIAKTQSCSSSRKPSFYSEHKMTDFPAPGLHPQDSMKGAISSAKCTSSGAFNHKGALKLSLQDRKFRKTTLTREGSLSTTSDSAPWIN